jgi:ribosomal protein L7/L12
MKTNLDTDISLKEAKDYVDALRDDMRRKGIIK